MTKRFLDTPMFETTKHGLTCPPAQPVHSIINVMHENIQGIHVQTMTTGPSNKSRRVLPRETEFWLFNLITDSQNQHKPGV